MPNLPGGVGPGLAEHVGRHVDTDHATALADLGRRQETIQAATGTEVDDDLARLQAGYRLGVAAAEPHVGTIGHQVEIGATVAQAGRHDDIDRRVVADTATAAADAAGLAGSVRPGDLRIGIAHLAAVLIVQRIDAQIDRRRTTLGSVLVGVTHKGALG